MKNIFLLLLFIYANAITAQIPDYFEGNPKWCVTNSWSDSQSGCIHYVDQVHYINGDTTFNSIVYKKLYTRGVNYGCGISPDYYNYLEDYLRQEGEIIYRYYPELDSEHIMYDFSLLIGDTIPRGGIDYSLSFGDQIFPDTSLIYIVSGVDSLLIESDYYKKIILNVFSAINGDQVGPISPSGVDYYIEGIGHQYGFIWHFYPPAEWQTVGLHVFNKGDILYYEFEESGGSLWCDFSVSVKEHERNNIPISIYPNPVINELKIELSTDLQIDIIRIYAINGQELLSKKAETKSSQSINVSILESGMYILQVELENGYRSARKFVKE